MVGRNIALAKQNSCNRSARNWKTQSIVHQWGVVINASPVLNELFPWWDGTRDWVHRPTTATPLPLAYIGRVAYIRPCIWVDSCSMCNVAAVHLGKLLWYLHSCNAYHDTSGTHVTVSEIVKVEIYTVSSHKSCKRTNVASNSGNLFCCLQPFKIVSLDSEKMCIIAAHGTWLVRCGGYAHWAFGTPLPRGLFIGGINSSHMSCSITSTVMW